MLCLIFIRSKEENIEATSLLLCKIDTMCTLNLDLTNIFHINAIALQIIDYRALDKK